MQGEREWVAQPPSERIMQADFVANATAQDIAGFAWAMGLSGWRASPPMVWNPPAQTFSRENVV